MIIILVLTVVFSISCSKDSKVQKEIKVTDEKKAHKAILNHYGSNYTLKDIRSLYNGEISPNNNDYAIVPLDNVIINNKPFYRFEKVSIGGKGRSPSYLVSS